MPAGKLSKVLLAYSSRPPIMGYLERAFRRQGIECRTVFADSNHWFDRRFIHLINKTFHNLRLLPKNRSLFDEHPLAHKNYRSALLLERFRSFRPDLVLVIRGIPFPEGVLREVRKEALLFGWWIEREERMEEAFREAHLYDWYFFMNSSCVAEGRRRGSERFSFLPHAVDPEIFRPITGVVKEHDVCFVGGWSPKRQGHIEAVIEVTGNVVVYGPKWLKKTWRNAGLRRCVRGAYIDGEELVRLYNRSRIVLNVTNWGFGEGRKRSGMNMRVLEVPACGAFLLTDGSVDMESLVRAGEHVAVYEGIEELKNHLRHYLDHPEEREAIGVAGFGHVRTRYTYDNVVTTIIGRFHDLPGVE